MKSPSKTKTYRKCDQEVKIWSKLNSGIINDNNRWYCGITNDPKIRKSQHMSDLKKSPYYFNSWYVKSYRIAKALETHFHCKGMVEHDFKGGAKKDSYYIYVFKKYPTIFDRLFK